jgi:hypothetical protein
MNLHQLPSPQPTPDSRTFAKGRGIMIKMSMSATVLIISKEWCDQQQHWHRRLLIPLLPLG